MTTQTPPPVERAPTADRVPSGIEANGINTIVEGERKGRPSDLFMPWFASNVGVFGIDTGTQSVGCRASGPL